MQTVERKRELAVHLMDDEVLRQGVVKYCNIREEIAGTLPVITTDPRKDAVLATLSDAGFLR